MQKTMIKSLLAVAVAGTFATCASAAPLNGVNDWYTATATAPKYGAIDVNKLQENFTNINTELEAATATIALNFPRKLHSSPMGTRETS